MAFLLADAGRGEVTPGEAEKLGRLVSEDHKAVHLTEIEERLRRLEEELPVGHQGASERSGCIYLHN